MRQFTVAGIIALGVASLLGGVCALFYGVVHPGPTVVVGFGPLDGVWPAENYCFLGGVMVALGGGLTTFGFLVRAKSDSAQVGRAYQADASVSLARDNEFDYRVFTVDSKVDGKLISRQSDL
jgi:hypothetical protein